MARRKDLSYLTVAWLAAVAIAGRLSMHGLDPAVFQPDQASSHGVHDTDPAEQGLHAAIGLCVVTIATSLGLALATSTAAPPSGCTFQNEDVSDVSEPDAEGRASLAGVDRCLVTADTSKWG